MFIQNTQAKKMADHFEETQQQMKSGSKQAEQRLQRQMEMSIQEYESKIQVLKLSHNKLENENEELRDEAEELKSSKSLM